MCETPDATTSELPRDLQLRVLSAAFSDVDTRIQWGAIGRLRIPPAVAERISSVLKVPHTHFVRDDVGRVLRTTTTTGSSKMILRVWTVTKYNGSGGPSTTTVIGRDSVWLRPYHPFIYRA